jgi:hypothetical protein
MDGTTDYSGTLTGRFFGPAAEEVGAVIQASSAGGAMVVGNLVGPRGSGAGASQTPLLNLPGPTAVAGSDGQFNFTPSLSPSYSTVLNSGMEITYDPVGKTYRFKSPSPGNPGPVAIDRTLTEVQRNAAASNATFTAYQGTGFTARMYNPGPSNPQLVLSYTSFAEIIEDTTNQGRAVTSAHYIPFGGQTPNFQVPTTGSATYSGVVYGSGDHNSLANDAALAGTSTFNVNFATNAANMQLSVTATDKITGTVMNMGNLGYTGTLGGSCPGGCNRNTFQLSIDPVAVPGGTGQMNGQFNGPNAAEYGASFRFDIPGANGGNFAGVTVGKKN